MTNQASNKETQESAPDTNKEGNMPEGAPPIEDMPFEETLEAILFAAGHAMTYEQLASTFHITKNEMKKRAEAFASRYNESGASRGVIFLLMEDACQLCTKPEYLPYIREALGIRKSGSLSTSSIETLAIIAYNQPVTRAYVDTVRAVDSNYAITNLLERGLIESKGRLDAPGRPMLYGTTHGFLRCFGLSSLSDLPGISADEAADMLERMQRKIDPFNDPNQLTMTDATDITDSTAAGETAAQKED